MTDFADDPSSELARKAKALEIVALIEGVSYVILFAFWVTGNEIGTKIFGSIHGWVFIGFALMVVGIRKAMGWTWLWAAIAIGTGPLGALLTYHRLRSRGVPEALTVR